MPNIFSIGHNHRTVENVGGSEETTRKSPEENTADDTARQQPGETHGAGEIRPALWQESSSGGAEVRGRLPYM
jgi:hypothetical protein